MDERKNEAITRTFKQVAKHFSETFHEMVPQGQADLVMLKENPDNEEFTGIGIRVSFGGGEEPTKTQLSGGQKALIALALIFAIQRADPAPFYLFDEVDAELDTNYRVELARLMQKQAEQQGAQCQIFCTTFKPELLDVGTRFYRIVLRNETSRIEKTSKEEAQEFVSTRQSFVCEILKIEQTYITSFLPKTVERNYPYGSTLESSPDCLSVANVLALTTHPVV